jgi:hypothetical protein
MIMNDLQKLAFSAYKGQSETKNKSELNTAIREAVREACGGEWNYWKFRKNYLDVFELIVKLMPAAQAAGLGGKYDIFAEFQDTAMGDKNYFTVEDTNIYPVYTSSRGNADIERQKITKRNFTVATDVKAIKFYDELDMFMAGKVDFSELADKSNEGMMNHVGLLISDTIYGSYAAIDTEYKVTGAYDATNLSTIAKYVRASTGAERLQIWGDIDALANIADGFGYSDNAKDRANALGYYASFRSMDLIALPQAYRPLTQTFAVNSSFVILLPANEKIVKVQFEGDPVLEMSTDTLARNDMQMEIYYGRRVGAAALTVPEGKFGMYIFQ